MPAAAVASRTPATGGMTGVDFGASGEILSDMIPSYASQTRASHAELPCSVRCSGLPGPVFRAWTRKIAGSASPPKAGMGSGSCLLGPLGDVALSIQGVSILATRNPRLLKRAAVFPLEPRLADRSVSDSRSQEPPRTTRSLQPSGVTQADPS